MALFSFNLFALFVLLKNIAAMSAAAHAAPIRLAVVFGIIKGIVNPTKINLMTACIEFRSHPVVAMDIRAIAIRTITVAYKVSPVPVPIMRRPGLKTYA